MNSVSSPTFTIMNILVCLSQVPDTTSKISVAASGDAVEKTGLKYILNPYDEYAIEEGLRLREKHTGSVTAITMGPDTAKEILRTALAMGVDKAVLIKDDKRDDSFGVAHNIAAYAQEMKPDLILLGRQSIDYDSFQLAPSLAELLSLPGISMVSSLSIDGSALKAERDIEGGKEQLEASLPCVISVQKGINDPRYPKLPDIMKAKSKPIEERPSVAVDKRQQTVGISLPSTQRVGKILGAEDADIAEFVRLLHEEAKVI